MLRSIFAPVLVASTDNSIFCAWRQGAARAARIQISGVRRATRRTRVPRRLSMVVSSKAGQNGRPQLTGFGPAPAGRPVEGKGPDNDFSPAAFTQRPVCR